MDYETFKLPGDVMPEECGVFGVYMGDSNYDPAELTYIGLYALQHRGQESAGIAVSSGKEIRQHKGMGLCSEVFRDTLSGIMDGQIAIGHARYSTTGDSKLVNAQPLVVSYRKGELAIAHNGNLINSSLLREKLVNGGSIFQTTIDTEIMAVLLAKNAGLGLVASIRRMMQTVRGSYALVIMTHDKMIAVRDPLGIRPLALGKLDNSYIVASESCAFDAVDAEFIRDIQPGEILVIDKDGLHSHESEIQKRAACIFEYVYFARPDSNIDGVSVYKAREKMGTLLARAYPVEADLVGGVPDSATPAASGYAAESGIPFTKALAKNRYVGRTFIQPSQTLRERGVKLKLNAIKRNIEGKRLILIDDSIVRGTTSKKIVEMLKSAGAKEVHMRISSPPVICPCFFGIDTPSHEQLIGSKHTVEEIRQLIGADSLHYLSLEDLLESVDGASECFCTGCFDGNYPVDMKQALQDTDMMEV